MNIYDKIYVSDKTEKSQAMSRCTDLCIAAHQDDVEIMAFAPTVKCYDDKNKSFCAVVVTDGAGSPRSGIYADYTDEEMMKVRITEQKNAADIGRYGFLGMLGCPSKQVKSASDTQVSDEIAEIIKLSRPETVYTHNLADKHDTHVGVALKTIAALRSLPEDIRPKKVYSLEVWRGLDWLCDSDKTCFDTSPHPNLAAALLGVYDSQIAGGKRYDNAAIGRRLANATFFESHNTDISDSMSYGLDITDLVYSELSASEFITKYIDSFKNEVLSRLEMLTND